MFFGNEYKQNPKLLQYWLDNRRGKHVRSQTFPTWLSFQNKVVAFMEFTDCDFQGQDLSHSRWVKTHVGGSDMIDTFWPYAQLLETTFTACSFQNAIFSDSVLQHVSFSHGDFGGAVFHRATLTGVRFLEHCTFDGADFRVVRGVSFLDADTFRSVPYGAYFYAPFLFSGLPLAYRVILNSQNERELYLYRNTLELFDVTRFFVEPVFGERQKLLAQIYRFAQNVQAVNWSWLEQEL